MDFLNGLDGGHLLGSGGVATAIWWVSVKVLKPLLEGFLDKMPKAIADNTSAVKELIEQQQRASGYTREEHATITTHLKLLTDTLLKVNGIETPTETSTDPTQGGFLEKTIEPAINTTETDRLRAELRETQSELRRVVKFLKGDQSD